MMILSETHMLPLKTSNYKHMKFITLFISSLIVILMVSACQEDFLEKYPLDQVSEGDFLLKTKDHEIYMNQFYNWDLLKTGKFASGGGLYGLDINSDNFIGQNGLDDRLKGVRVSESNNSDWDMYYKYVRSINFYFDNYEKCIDTYDEYKEYLGEAYFFRALIYYQLMQRFGDVIWFDHQLDSNSPELYGKRTPRNEVADHIIADLDEAIKHLPATKRNDGLRIDKWIALGFKSKVALFEGTWEKYHNGTAFGVSGADPDKYLKIAEEAAKKVIDSHLYKLYSTGDINNDYYQVHIQRDYSASKEVMFWKKFSIALGITNKRMYTTEKPGGKGLTKSLIDAFLCIDGLPTTKSPLFSESDLGDLEKEAQNRDPRFQQTIWTPKAPWKIDNGKVTSWDDGIYSNLFRSSSYSTTTAYVPRKGYDPDITTHSTSAEEAPDLIMRYAEILLNYAEAKAELGTITQADIDISIKPIRDRVGMPNIKLSDITVDTNWHYPDLSPIINEVRRERRIELNNEGHRWYDIARWAAADELIIGKRPKGIKVGTENFPYFYKHGEGKYPVDSEGFIDPYQESLGDAGYGFNKNRDYLDYIGIEQITLNPNLGQNPGWE